MYISIYIYIYIFFIYIYIYTYIHIYIYVLYTFIYIYTYAQVKADGHCLYRAVADQCRQNLASLSDAVAQEVPTTPTLQGFRV